MIDGVLAACVAAARRSADERERSGAARAAGEAAVRRPRGDAFRASLRAPGIRVIAECKRRSPSKGVIRDLYDPPAIAAGYAAAGAAAISVLTEATFFDGSLAHLTAVRAAVPGLPLLRKDFIVTPFQIIEARAAGADAVLLIAAALDDAQLTALSALAADQQLAVLVEVHDRAELDRAAAAGASLVGVNSRNLRTMQVSLEVFDELAPHLPAAATAVAESGLRTAADLTRLRAAGYSAFLIGERFMAAPDPGAALAALLRDEAAPAGERA